MWTRTNTIQLSMTYTKLQKTIKFGASVFDKKSGAEDSLSESFNIWGTAQHFEVQIFGPPNNKHELIQNVFGTYRLCFASRLCAKQKHSWVSIQLLQAREWLPGENYEFSCLN